MAKKSQGKERFLSSAVIPHSKPKLFLTLQPVCPCKPLIKKKIRQWVEAALQAGTPAKRPISTADVTIRLTDRLEAEHLNREFRKHRYAPNILTFLYEVPDETSCFLADLVVCPEVVLAEANLQGKPLENHFAHLIIHGVLHAQGYRHDTKSEEALMQRKEIKALSQFCIPNPY